ncbi:MAG: hypothetical protein ABJH45_25895 [Paracoccaceae bacterium]
MRDLATEPKKAYHDLGNERGQAFIGLVADFRAALFAGDVPGSPRSATKDKDCFKLDWFISTGCILRTVITASSSGDDAWKSAHRIHLDSIDIDGEELA